MVHSERRSAASMARGGIPIPTPHPVTAERLKGVYTGVPSRVCVTAHPSWLVSSTRRNSGETGRPTYCSVPRVRTTMFRRASNTVPTQSPGICWAWRIEAMAAGSRAAVST